MNKLPLSRNPTIRTPTTLSESIALEPIREETTFRQEYDHFRDLALLFYSSNRTVDSYFWEARQIFKEENYFSDRVSFIRAVSGQSVRGYERVALERGELPKEFMSAISLHNKKSEDRNAELLFIQDSILEKIQRGR